MHRSIVTTILCACTVSFLTVLPALAYDPPTLDPPGTVPTPFSPSNTLHQTGGFILWLPVRLPATIVSTAVGTPIAIVRKEWQEMRDTVKGGLDHPIALLPALALGLPSAAFGAFFDGLAAGPCDAFANAKRPFSKESFSLGKGMYDSYNYDYE